MKRFLFIMSEHTNHYRVWRSYGECMDVGSEVGAWLDEYLGGEGFKMYYMSPHHKGRMLQDDVQWADVCREGEQVYYTCDITYIHVHIYVVYVV